MTSTRPRKIVVNGVEFRWKAEIRADQNKRIVRLSIWQIRAGSTLIAWLTGSPAAYIDTAYPTPNDVRIITEYGISKGWTYGKRGANLHLSSADSVDLAGLRLLDSH
jgi:hypothetical protein